MSFETSAAPDSSEFTGESNQNLVKGERSDDDGFLRSLSLAPQDYEAFAAMLSSLQDDDSRTGSIDVPTNTRTAHHADAFDKEDVYNVWHSIYLKEIPREKADGNRMALKPVLDLARESCPHELDDAQFQAIENGILCRMPIDEFAVSQALFDLVAYLVIKEPQWGDDTEVTVERISDLLTQEEAAEPSVN
jgi:hypothetical protein